MEGGLLQGMLGTLYEAAVKTILLVDDDCDVLSCLEDALISSGYNVIAQPHAEPALAVLKQGIVIDIVVTDYTMPGMHGGTFLKEVRRLVPSVPMVVLSGNDSIESHLRSLNLNGFDYLFKPIRSVELLGVVKAALDRDISIIQ